MKKFLTVLLALSVVFTYSFSAVGTAFADTTVANSQAQYLQNLAQAEAQALNDLAKEYNYAKSQVTYKGDSATVVTSLANPDDPSAGTTTADGNYVIAGAEWLKQLDAVYEDAKKAVQATTVTLQTADAYNTNGDKTVEELTALYAVKNATAFTTDLYADNGKYAVAAAKAQFAVDQAAFIANANSVDTKIYSTKAQATAYKDVTYGDKTVSTKVPKEYADAVVAKAAYELAQIKLAGTEATATAVGTVKTQLADELAKYIKYDAAKKVYLLDEDQAAVGDILTVVEEKQQEAQGAADKAALLADLAVKISDATVATANYDADQLAAWTKLRDAYNKVCTYLINAGEITRGNLPVFPVHNITKVNGVTKAVESATSYQDAVADMEAVVAQAATLKAKTTIDGDPEYDAAKVDELLDAAYVAQYKKAATTPYVASVENFAAAKLTYSTSFAKEHKKAAVAAKVNADEMKYGSDAYYALEWAKVVAAVAAYNAAIDAAATTNDITKAETALTDALAEVKTAAGVDTLYTAGVCKTAAEAALDMVAKYVDTLNAGKTGDDRIDNPYTAQTDLNKWFAEKGARTDAEVKALYDTLKAEVAKTPTIGAEKAASDAKVANVKAMIEKLPTALNATLADAEATAAAKSAFDELTPAEQAKIPAENAKLAALVTNLKALYNAEIQKKIDKANEGGITVEDAAIFDELKTLNDAYKALDGNDNTTYTTFLATAKANLKTAELNAVVEAIKAIPAAVTLGDKAAVEAARKAYDAYVAKYTDYAAGVNAAADVTNFSSLLMAEAMIKALDVNAVESLKIKASSKAVKGKITVKWTVKGDASGIDGYRVYKSKKANSGYKFMGKTKKLSMANKKDLKKGTRYFYKVRAYKVVDGKTYYSDYSNKANRIAK